jgi:hypothetical protein
MPLASGKYAIAICQRCNRKRPYQALVSDPNSPGLRVCEDGCVDDYDPYRLPAPPPDAITLQFPRPDVSLVVPSAYMVASDGFTMFTIVNDDNEVPGELAP